MYEHTKDAIPNDEYTTKVLVDAVTINSVVNSMVTRGVENVLQWTYLVNHLQTTRIHTCRQWQFSRPDLRISKLISCR